MVLYTVIPLEEIFKDEKKADLIQIPYSRGKIEVELTSYSTAKIIRLFSHDLNDYLHPKLQPGTEIKLRWEIDSDWG